MITKVVLNNWKSHEYSELEFTSGTNGLVGIVGSGKTSILDAICFAFFGTFPALQTRKVKLDDIIMKKPETKDSAEVRVQFTINGSQYCVKRMVERERGTSFSELSENGKVIESPSTKNVTDCVEKVLKVNYELFSKAIYSEQNSIDYFLNMGKGQRMKKIDELLMIDRFEQARTNAVSLANKLVDVKIGKQGTVDRMDPSEIRKSISELKKSVADLENSKKALVSELEDSVSRKAELEAESIQLSKVRNETEALRMEKSSIESAIKETCSMIERMESAIKDIGESSISDNQNSAEELSKRIDDMASFLENKQSEYSDMQRKLSDSKAIIEVLKGGRISKLEKDVSEKLMIKSEFEHLRDKTGEDVDRQMIEKKSLLDKIILEIESSRARMSELSENMEKISSVEGRCPICDSPLSEERKKIIISERMKDIEKLDMMIQDAMSRRQLAEKDIDSLQSASKKLSEMLSEIRDLDSARSELENSMKALNESSQIAEKLSADLASMKSEIDLVQNEMSSAKDSKRRLEIMSSQMKEFEERRERLKSLSAKRDELSGLLDEMEKKMSGKECSKVEEWLRNTVGRVKELEAKIESTDAIRKEKSCRLEEQEKALKDSEEEKAAIERMEIMIKEMKIFVQALKQTQVELRKEFVEAVNYTMGKLWPTLYPYEDFIGVRLAIEEGDYVLQLQERATNWINVEGVVSGGERSMACLALRIAFALVLAPHLRILVLDEPTANLDSNSVKVLSRTLRESIGEFIDQCFIITHDDVFEEAVTGNAYRMERDKGKNEATRIIQIN